MQEHTPRAAGHEGCLRYDDAAKQQEAWIAAKLTTEDERKAAREKLVVIRSIQGADLS